MFPVREQFVIRVSLDPRPLSKSIQLLLGKALSRYAQLENRHARSAVVNGILIFGKMSVGVRKIITALRIRMSKARTMNVYGRSSAIRTIHISATPLVRSSSRLLVTERTS